MWPATRRPVASQTAVIVSGTKNPDGSFSAANGVTVVAGGELYTGARFTVNGVSDPGHGRLCRKTNTLSLSTPKTYAIGVTVPGSGGTANRDGDVHGTVNDTIPPVLALPAPAPTEATSTAGAVVNYTATATDNTDGRVTAACAPPSGSTFRLGTTRVNCSAHDSAGNTSSGSFTVTVRDTTAPTLTVPANISTKATSAAGAVVTYVATATDIASGAITPVCTTASGATFPIGTTPVTCTATDPSGNSTSQTFAVTITPPYRYSGFFSPVNMGGADAFGLNLTVNSVNGGRNVPFKWEVFDDSTGLELTDPARVEIQFVPYAQLLTQFSSLPGATSPLPNRNVCADAGRTIIPISGGTGKTTALKFTNGQFNEGIQVPTKPAPAAWNCYVAWTRVIGDPSPGITSLFTLT